MGESCGIASEAAAAVGMIRKFSSFSAASMFKKQTPPTPQKTKQKQDGVYVVDKGGLLNLGKKQNLTAG